MKEITIIGIHISDRVKDATKVQDILTRYGCSIKTRLGMHDISEEYCSSCGLIILELIGDPDERQRLEKELLTVENLEVQKMHFNC
ncbi:MAG: hypothetical protein M0R21_08700 [Lentimicrobiaceae bacterium]|jgi:hypothetical protein|nr:hypothetical protein [Lentimicrobiaceae bacterium]